MTVVMAVKWLDELLGLRDARTGEVRGSGLAYAILLCILLGEPAWRL